MFPFPSTNSHLITLVFPYTGVSAYTGPKASTTMAARQGIVCCISGWSLKSLHMCSLFGVWVSKRLWGRLWLILFFYVVAKPFGCFSLFSNSYMCVSMLTPKCVFSRWSQVNLSTSQGMKSGCRLSMTLRSLLSYLLLSNTRGKVTNHVIARKNGWVRGMALLTPRVSSLIGLLHWQVCLPRAETPRLRYSPDTLCPAHR